MRKVFLENLPKKKRSGKMIVDWKNSYDSYIKFIYDDTEGVLQIKEYLGDCKVNILYNDRIFKIATNDLCQCKIAKIIEKRTGEFKLEIGFTFKDDKRDIVIINKEYRYRQKSKYIEKEKWYEYKCNKCGNKDWKMESNLINQKQGCNVCGHRKVVRGINDIATTDPWMMPYLVDKEDAYKYSSRSMQKIRVKCPDCGNIKSVIIKNLYRQGFSCNKCGDGFSYPNKFMFNLLEQLGVKFETEYSPDWAENRKYDFYIPSMKLIIEMDGGLGHGKKDTMSLTREKSKEIDYWKDKQANEHELKVIRINCDYDDTAYRFEYIKNNVISSELSKIFDLYNINWIMIEEYCVNNLIKVVCEVKNKNPHLLSKDISNMFNIGRNTAIRYLKQGSKLGWCEYDTMQYTKSIRRKIEVYKENESLGIFESLFYLEQHSENIFGVKLNRKSISDVCLGKQKEYKGFIFKYV